MKKIIVIFLSSVTFLSFLNTQSYGDDCTNLMNQCHQKVNALRSSTLPAPVSLCQDCAQVCSQASVSCYFYERHQSEGAEAGKLEKEICPSFCKKGSVVR